MLLYKDHLYDVTIYKPIDSGMYAGRSQFVRHLRSRCCPCTPAEQTSYLDTEVEQAAGAYKHGFCDMTVDEFLAKTIGTERVDSYP